MQSDDETRLGQLVAALQLVAADPEAQREAAPELVAIAQQMRRGEPVLEWVDQSLFRSGAVPSEMRFLLRRIDALFDQLVAREPALDADSLLSAREWQLMRALAHSALQRLGVERPRATG